MSTETSNQNSAGSSSASSTAITSAAAPVELNRPHLIGDTMAIVQRNLITIKRSPQLLVFATIQPVIFVLMFRYVFGGAISTGNLPYVDYLMPGIFAQTVAFGSISTGIGLADDLQKGIIDRFRSLPMAPSAVLVGRTTADVIRNIFVQALMVLVGFLVGFRIHNGAGQFLIALVLLLGLGFALSWVFGLIGLLTKDAETTQAAAFPLMAPLVFASSAFAPVATMPTWLQGWARNQPVSATIAAVRRLSLTQAQALSIGLPDSALAYTIRALAWIAGITVVFGFLAIRRYRKVV